MKLVISFPGGGIRGVVQAHIADRMPHTLLRKASMFAGTSTGGLIAIGLGLGRTAAEMESVYADRGGEIFTKTAWRTILPAFVPKYSTAGLQRVLEDVYGLPTHFSACSTPVMVNSYDRQSGRPFHLKSWRTESAGFLAHEAARATSAAPTYFEAFMNRYWDGGVWSNDPALDAYCEARVLWPGEDILVLSIGNGGARAEESHTPGAIQGFSAIGKELVNALLNSPDESTQYRMKCLLPAGRYFHVDACLPEGISRAMDDASPEHIRQLQGFADTLYGVHEKMFDTICEMVQ